MLNNQLNLWSDIETIINDIRINCVYLNTKHQERCAYYSHIAHYFRIPTIILASFVSVSSIGGNYFNQHIITAFTCLTSLCIGLLNSIEMYLKIIEIIEKETKISKKYYLLSIDIHKLLNLRREYRSEDPKEMLDKYFREYNELVLESNMLNYNNFPDNLIKIPKLKHSLFLRQVKTIETPNSSSSSISSDNPLDINDEQLIDETL